MSETDFVNLLNDEMKELIENTPQVKQLKKQIQELTTERDTYTELFNQAVKNRDEFVLCNESYIKEREVMRSNFRALENKYSELKKHVESLTDDNKRLNELLVGGTEVIDYWNNKYLEEQAKNTELRSELARANLQVQFQVGEVDIRDKEIESLKGLRTSKDTDILTILDNFSEIAYKEGCVSDITKVIDYINSQRAELERLQQTISGHVTDQEVWVNGYKGTQIENEQLKAEVKRLTEQSGKHVIESDHWKSMHDVLAESYTKLKNDFDNLEENYRLCKDANNTIKMNAAELQKQVDELKTEIKLEKEWGDIKVAQALADFKIWKQQTVKDTAKEIFEWLKSEVIMTEIPHGSEPCEEDVEAVMWWQIEEHFKKKYGVEVE